MSSKADLINFAVAQLHGLPEALNGKVDETLVRTCEVCSYPAFSLSDRVIPLHIAQISGDNHVRPMQAHCFNYTEGRCGLVPEFWKDVP